ncbi:MAG TPA: lytic transglycosylase domain-containing protein [Candidatus Binataceae bacterium]|nr:lytic transglycosylase domain-containing protein [Candidatus Binataceae bacterium]
MRDRTEIIRQEIRFKPALMLILGLLSIAAMARAETATTENFYVEAAAQEGVPRDLLIAIAGAESDFHPWALNIKGREIYCRSEQEAERLLATVDDVDIGLMQINWPLWGRRFGLSKTQLLDPRTNLIYGARILKEDLTRDGDIWWRISDYHAGSVQRRDRYNKSVYEHYLSYLRGLPER